MALFEGGYVMELSGDLKKQVEQAETKEEKKKLIENAGMKLTDDELNMVAGGGQFSSLFVDWPVYFSDAGG